MIPKTRILIVDDHAMVRLALAEAIAQQDDLELVGEAENGARAIALYRDLQPDVVTMDYQMPGLNGAEAIGEILAEFPEARIVLLSIYETPESLWRATEAGALGCVSKGVEIDEIITAVRAVASGVSYYSEGLEKKLDERRAQEALSPRETEVLAQIVSGNRSEPWDFNVHCEASPRTRLHQTRSQRSDSSCDRRRETRNHSIGLTLRVNNQSGLSMQISSFMVRA